MPRRPRTSGCGPCACWAAAPASVRATSPRSWPCWCRNRAEPCKRRPWPPWRESIPSKCPRRCWPVGRATARRCGRRFSTCSWAATPGPKFCSGPSSASNCRPATSTPHAASGSCNRPNDQIRAKPANCWPARSTSNRRQVVDAHGSVLTMAGDAQAGAAVFAKRCAVCHLLARRRPRGRPQPGLAHRLFAATSAGGDARSQSGRRSQVSRLSGRRPAPESASPACSSTKPATASP